MSPTTHPTQLQAPTVDGTDSKKWTITVGSLQPSPDGVPNKCATLLGKFKVTEFKATSWHGSAAAPSTTAATTYFYIGEHPHRAGWVCLGYLTATGAWVT